MKSIVERMTLLTWTLLRWLISKWSLLLFFVMVDVNADVHVFYVKTEAVVRNLQVEIRPRSAEIFKAIP